MYDVVIGYVIGTVVGIFLFRMYVQERIVTATLDMLIEGDYVRSYIDQDGITQLYRWDESDDLNAWETLERLIEDMEANPEQYDSMINSIIKAEEEDNETDDTP
jgi:threonine synthase